MNHWPECIDIWHESPFGRGDSIFIQMKSLGSCMAGIRGLNFYLVIYREMLKTSFQEPTDQFNQTW